ncbi:MAG: DUF86 domain-containing protein [Clostridium sp.]|nr:DUF86 domain-containing protein [Clostridium sp.]
MNHRDYVTIGKIVKEIEIADAFLYNITLEEFLQDEKTKRAICMTVINIGELVKTVTGDTRIKYDKVKWREAAGFRDIAAHKYQTLNMGDVYKTVKEDFPFFQSQMEEILRKETDEKL